jgi:hypothetical protein
LVCDYVDCLSWHVIVHCLSVSFSNQYCFFQFLFNLFYF